MITTPPSPALAGLVVLLSACGARTDPVLPDAALVDRDAGILGRPEHCNGIDDDRDGKRDEGCPIRVSPGNGYSPVLVGDDKLLWLSATRLNGENRTALLSTNLSTEATTEIALLEGTFPMLSASARYAVLTQGLNSPCIAVDVHSRQTAQVRFPTQMQQRCQIVDDLVLASTIDCESPCDDHEIYAHDLRTQESRRLLSHPGLQERPTVSDGLLVWLDSRLSSSPRSWIDVNIFAAEMGSDTVWPVTRVERRDTEASFALHGREVLTNDGCAIATYDLRSTARTVLSAEVQDCDAVVEDLSTRFALIRRDPLGVSDLWLLDRQTLRSRRLTDYPRRSYNARLNDHFIVWEDDRNDTASIYFTDISDMDEGDFFPEGQSEVTP